MLTVHLALVRQYDFSPSTWRVNSQSLQEALLNVGAPNSFSVTSVTIIAVVIFYSVICRNAPFDDVGAFVIVVIGYTDGCLAVR